MCSVGHHQRSSASWNISRCTGVPSAKTSSISSPWRMWKPSSAMIRRRMRLYGPYEQFLNTACWEISAPASTR